MKRTTNHRQARLWPAALERREQAGRFAARFSVEVPDLGANIDRAGLGGPSFSPGGSPRG